MSRDPWRSHADQLVDDLKDVFGDRLQAVVAYGAAVEGATAPITCLALVTTLTADDLQACARHARQWTRAQVATPLVVPVEEFHRSLDTFPLEYGEIIRTHALVFGDDPFTGAVIAPADLRRACELQAKSQLLHLREAFIESGGNPAAVAGLVKASAPAFAALLRNVARLDGVFSGDRAESTRAGARAVGLSDSLVANMLDLERDTPIPATDASRLFPDYLAGVEQLARAVDRWHSP
jgi:hypothetical protein